MEARLIEIVQNSPYLTRLFDVCDTYLSDYYIGAGVITQTVWNHLHGYERSYGIVDADVIYFDSSESADRKEERLLEKRIKEKLADFPFEIDLTNEALVHHWYEQKFNRKISPYQSCEQAIRTWPATASAVGVRRTNSGYEVYAPFGLEDLFQMIIRPNKALITEEIYQQKARKWKGKWPQVMVMPW